MQTYMRFDNSINILGIFEDSQMINTLFEHTLGDISKYFSIQSDLSIHKLHSDRFQDLTVHRIVAQWVGSDTPLFGSIQDHKPQEIQALSKSNNGHMPEDGIFRCIFGSLDHYCRSFQYHLVQCRMLKKNETFLLKETSISIVFI